MLIVTAWLAAALALQQIRLAFGIIGLRRDRRVSLGDGDDEGLLRASRAFGNLVEYAPIMLVLIGCLELNDAPRWALAVLAALFLAGRVLHPIGLVGKPGGSTERVLGMHLTIWPMAAAAMANPLWLLIGA